MIDYYEPDIVSANDYYPFGMTSRVGLSTKGIHYRYGFNGKENDWEAKGWQNQVDYGMRIYDPRVGRFLSVDPLTRSYPMLTPYQFASNRPIDGDDLDGLEWRPIVNWLANKAKAAGKPRLAGFIRSFGAADVMMDSKQLLDNTRKGDFSAVGQQLYGYTSFGMVQGTATTTKKALIDKDKEAQGELMGIGFQGLFGVRSIQKGGYRPGRGPSIVEETVTVRQAEANGGTTTNQRSVVPEATTTSEAAVVTVNFEALYLKYKNSRPYLSQKTINEVWENAKQADGNVYDPNTGELLTWDKFKSRYEQWHMGHKPGHEYRTLLQRLRNGEISEAEFKRQYNDSNNYQPESPAANMSHQYEQRTQTSTQNQNGGN